MFNRVLICCLLACPAAVCADVAKTTRGSELPPSESADYRLSWLDLPFGEAHATWEESQANYTASFSLKTTGVAAVFKPQAISLTVSGHLRHDGPKTVYVPTTYHFVNERPEKHKETTIRYDDQGRVAGLDILPRGDDADRIPVSAKGRDGAIDPLTILASFNGMALFGVPNPELDMFDGSRLTHLSATLLPGDAPSDALDTKRYHFARTPAEGFTAKERKRLKDDPGVTAAIDPQHSRFPDSLTASLTLGSVRITRVK